MNIQAEKLELIECLARINNFSLIDKLKSIKAEYSNDWWDQISKEEKDAIQQGLLDIEAGNVKTHEEVKQIYAKYL
jgi:hypothetical protein